MSETQVTGIGTATQPKKKVDWASEIRQLIVLAIAVLAVHSLIAKPFFIPSESMLPTLLTGDRLIVSKYPYGYSYLSPSLPILPEMKGRLFGRYPERGDIAIVKSPRDHDDWIKRVIGLPGDTVQMRNGVLWLNGVAVPKVAETPADIRESANTTCSAPQVIQYRFTRPDGVTICRYPRFRETLPSGRSYDVLDLGDTPQDNTPAMIVPEGHLFLMGDNRDNSEDSRFSNLVGGLDMLPIENLVGRAEFLTFSLDGSTTLNPLTWFGAFRPGRAFVSLHPKAGPVPVAAPAP
ncbi:signal peptidase I [Polymorphobacter sp. PAMC 29334]|uniref:signal peptidase I n=1 Tax=Polymorphobacter sp. PAMC 29334 TaxID=2862331 RepID=UPI001C792B74|nr:signal peptidase I [Polymorphobacter sp. PAMC 29334]QYE36180.1 signal peptidase I [Polymorphobacter sp. PAMC 29334]